MGYYTALEIARNERTAATLLVENSYDSFLAGTMSAEEFARIERAYEDACERHDVAYRQAYGHAELPMRTEYDTTD